MKGTRAHELPDSTKEAIARCKAKYPALTYRQLAEKFNCTYEQVRTAIRKAEKGELRGRRKVATSVQCAAELPEATGDVDAVFDELVEKGLTMLRTTALDPADFIRLLDTLMQTRKTNQQTRLQSHMKRISAELFASVVRRYEPDADNDRVIQILKEEEEKCKVSP